MLTVTGMERQLLAKLAAAGRDLGTATDLTTVLSKMQEADAVRACCKAAGRAFDVQQAATAVVLRARRRAGEIVGNVEFVRGRPKASCDGRFTHEDVGLSRQDANRWRRLAAIPEADFEQFIADATESGRELTTAAALKFAKQQAASGAPGAAAVFGETGTVQTLDELVASGEKFSTIYADPPWQYGNQATRASTDNHYATLSMDELMDMGEQVKELAENDAHLWLWTTTSFLPDAIPLMAAWGFKYKTNMVWVKPQMGIGNYLRVSHEHLLLGVRGALTTAANDQMSWVSADRTEHSAKPAEFRRIVERLSPGPYLELFGRQEIDGWKVFGNQIPKQLFPV